jgi:Core-2/I-Branching enzyme
MRAILPCSKPYPCVSDEHYFATVVAAAGRSNETTCAGNAMHVDWARAPGTGSPFTYWMKVSAGFRFPGS